MVVFEVELAVYRIHCLITGVNSMNLEYYNVMDKEEKYVISKR